MFKKLNRNQRIAATIGLIAVIVLAYIFLFYRPMRARIERYDTKHLEQRLKAEQNKSTSMQRMRATIQSNEQSNLGTVEPYDNLKNEITALNDILASTGTYNVTFSQPVKSGTTVRRGVEIEYTAGSYDAAVTVATNIYHCQYRCLLRTLEINSDSSSSGASVTVGATFIETTIGSTTASGLTNSSDSASSTSATTTSSGTGLSSSNMSGTIATRQD